MNKVSAGEKLLKMFSICNEMPKELTTDEVELFYWFKAANLAGYRNGNTEKDFDANGEVRMYYQNLCEYIRDYVCELKGYDTNVFSEGFWGWYAEMQSKCNNFADNVTKIKEYAKKFTYLIYLIRVESAKVQFLAKEAHIDMMCAILEKTSSGD